MPQALVRTRTADGVTLEGLWLQPAASWFNAPIDACLLLHGSASCFYAPGVLETFARRMAGRGVPALRVNTRGHDQIAPLPGSQPPRRGGAAFETLADAVQDVSAWVAWLATRGCTRVALVGHSVGGVKASYALAHAGNQLHAVSRLIVISSPRFRHANFQSSPRGAAFRRDFAEALRLVACGAGGTLIELTQPMPLVMTAAGIVEKYGPEDRYDLLQLLPRIGRPALVVIGSESPAQSIGFEGLPEALRALAAEQTDLTVDVVAGANINYSGHAEAPFERAWRWLT